MEEEQDRILWLMVSQFVQFHSAYHPQAHTIGRDDHLNLYFPKKDGEFGEHANRWSAVMWDVIDNANKIFKPKKKYKYDFEYRDEWWLFITLGDYVEYMKKLIVANV